MLTVMGEDSLLSASPEKFSNPSRITDSFYVIFFSPQIFSLRGILDSALMLAMKKK